MARILVVEDEPVMAEAISRGLRRHAHSVDVAGDGRMALDQLARAGYDVVVLDRDLPYVHGDQVCAAMAESSNAARVLMLTAAHDVSDRVSGLRLGADDYLPKPFSFEEFVARVEALARRSPSREDAVLTVHDLVIDPAKRTVLRAGSTIDLTAKEFGVLVELARQPGAVISAERLLERVWDENADPFTIAVRVTMVGLRKKLGDPRLIRTIRGVGYRIDEPR